ncbi:MAG: hypothetical protein HOE83_23335 [Alphaproteobacteria bacterium]|jgi:hypothetical protein|nr:hypothetical protein [Alphaproteobacteria bacterium]
MSNLPSITIDKVPGMLKYCRANNETFLMEGATGIAKTSFVKQFAASEGIAFKLFEIGGIGSEEVKGYGKLNEEEWITEFLPPERLPHLDRDGPEGILLLDEFAYAYDQTKNCVRQLITEGTLGQYTLPPGWQIAIATNRKEDGTSAGKIGANVYSACFSVEVLPSAECWLAHDKSEGGNMFVQAWVKGNPDMIYSREKTDKAFPTMRTLSKASRAVNNITDDDFLLDTIVGAAIGTGAAAKLLAFIKLAKSGASFPTWGAITSNPMSAPLPTDAGEHAASMSFAAITMIRNKLDGSNVDDTGAVVTYIDRLPRDYQIAFMHDLNNKSRLQVEEGGADIMDNSHITGWRSRNPDAIIG